MLPGNRNSRNRIFEAKLHGKKKNPGMEEEDEDDVLSFLGIHNLHKPAPSGVKRFSPKDENGDRHKKAKDQANTAAAVPSSGHTVLYSGDDDFLDEDISTSPRPRSPLHGDAEEHPKKHRKGAVKGEAPSQRRAKTKEEEEPPYHKKRSRNKETAPVKTPPKKKAKIAQASTRLAANGQQDHDDRKKAKNSDGTSAGAHKKSVSKFTNFQWDKDSPQKTRKKRPTKRNNKASNAHPEAGTELWIDKYVPITEADLALFHKRIVDVKAWLQAALRSAHPSGPRLLCLTGPAGCGKTALIRVLAAELGCEISEWVNPVHSSWKTVDSTPSLPYTPAMELFKQFMYSTRRYPSLVPSNSPRNKLILLEDLPFLDMEQQRKEFGVILEQTVRTSQFPLVLILSDTSLDNSPMRKLLPSSLLHDGRVAQIKCGPIAPSKLKKVLTRICEKENATPMGSSIESIIRQAGGDIRHAINLLQFLCNNPDVHPARKAAHFKVPAAKKRRQQPTDDKTTMGSRDVSLSIFHALGKVLYNKRLEREEEHDPSVHCDFVSHVTENNAEEVLELAFAEESTFLCFLHENYPLFMHEVEPSIMASSYLSDADLLASDWMHRTQMQGYSGSVGVRGYQWAHQAFPAPTKATFMSLYKPKMFQAQSDQKANQNLLRDIWATPNSPMTSLSSNVNTQEILPLLHKVARRTRPPHPVSGVISQGNKELIAKLCRFGSDGRGWEVLDKDERAAAPPSETEQEETTIAGGTEPPAATGATEQSANPGANVLGSLLPDDDITEFE